MTIAYLYDVVCIMPGSPYSNVKLPSRVHSRKGRVPNIKYVLPGKGCLAQHGCRLGAGYKCSTDRAGSQVDQSAVQRRPRMLEERDAGLCMARSAVEMR